ncbi:chordin-like [Panonychus citri]|uniref:chordin-like n=1 Tax=Panonychus citri TaxID=50023 RepID=UPI002307A40B|nr:chordin-like [Panonychus citri]
MKVLHSIILLLSLIGLSLTQEYVTSDPSSYQFNYTTSDSDANKVSKEEQGSANGQVNGKYGYADKLNECYFQPDGRYYQPGSSWHPYLPPFGINKCSLCTCQNITLKVTCRRHFTCPPLACDPEQSVREHPTDCCKKCPDSIQVKSLDGAFASDDGTNLADSNLDTQTTGVCVLLGRLYPNGHRWHPHVTPFGEIRCVKCVCKNGSIKCNRLKCPRGKCTNSPMMKKCCPNCGDDQKSIND